MKKRPKKNKPGACKYSDPGERVYRDLYNTNIYKQWWLGEVKHASRRPGFSKEWTKLKNEVSSKLAKDREGTIKEWIKFCNKWQVDIGPKHTLRPFLPVSFPVPFQEEDKGIIKFRREVSFREWKNLWPLVQYHLRADFGKYVKPGNKNDEYKRNAIYKDYIALRIQRKSAFQAYSILSKIWGLGESRIAHITSEINKKNNTNLQGISKKK